MTQVVEMKVTAGFLRSMVAEDMKPYLPAAGGEPYWATAQRAPEDRQIAEWYQFETTTVVPMTLNSYLPDAWELGVTVEMDDAVWDALLQDDRTPDEVG